MKRGQNISYEVLSFLVLLSGVNYSLVLYSHIIIDAKYISNYIKICENIYKAVIFRYNRMEYNGGVCFGRN